MHSDSIHVVICGGGVAALEGALRLRSLAEDRVEVTLLAPNEQFIYRPLAVREAVAFGSSRRYPLGDIARDLEADWVQDTLAAVDCARRNVRTSQGRELRYDARRVAQQAGIPFWTNLANDFQVVERLTGSPGYTDFGAPGSIATSDG